MSRMLIDFVRATDDVPCRVRILFLLAWSYLWRWRL